MLSGLYSLVKDWLHLPSGRQIGLAGADVRTVAELLRDRTRTCAHGHEVLASRAGLHARSREADASEIPSKEQI